MPDCLTLPASLSRVRQELNAEAAKLHQVVQEQSQQVAALKQHAERMEQQAESANDKVWMALRLARCLRVDQGVYGRMPQT